MQTLFETSNRLVDAVNLSFSRSLYHKINWKQRLIEIKGARGVGKTTVMLQRAFALREKNQQSVLYASLDDPYFFNHSIIETAEMFYKYGGLFLFLDEAHKYPAKQKQHDWSAELKNVYDRLPELKVVYSGSSVIQLYKGNGDLSRRKSSYLLNGLSFREYLEYNNIFKFPVLTIQEIISNPVSASRNISKKIKILPHFKSYLHHGHYPFYNEDPSQYFQKIKNIISVILEVDIPFVADINYETIGKLKKLFAVLSSTVPYTPNFSSIGRLLNISDIRTLYKYLILLEKAELIQMLGTAGNGNKLLQKPDKIYLNNPDIMEAMRTDEIEIGTIRETFFYNQVRQTNKISYPRFGDFLVEKKYIFEVGGKNKKQKQIKDMPNSFIVQDDIETGYANILLLWLFGFLY